MPDLNAAIREHLGPIPTVDEWLNWSRRTRSALLAVLDLHACHPDSGQGYGPDDDDTEGAYGYMSSVCTTCGTPGEYAIRWPCPTVRAIATGLGIEVGDGFIMLERAGGGVIRRDGDQITITPIAEVDHA